jgi:hypothetical protein
VGIALQPAVAAAVEAGARPRIRGEVAVPTSLKPSRVRKVRHDAGKMHNSADSKEPDEKKGDADPDSSRVPIVWH